jgi:hypothetical protein
MLDLKTSPNPRQLSTSLSMTHPKPEDHPLSAVRAWLCNISTARKGAVPWRQRPSYHGRFWWGSNYTGTVNSWRLGRKRCAYSTCTCVGQRNCELHLLWISANQFGYHCVGEVGGSGQNLDLHATQTFYNSRSSIMAITNTTIVFNRTALCACALMPPLKLLFLSL